MAIPKPIRPEYSTTIPSTGKKIKYQPFTVREEKVLILAAETEDLEEISNAIRNVLTNCITTAGVDVDELALFDIEYLFLKARAKSIGEKVELRVTDPSDPEYTVDHSINIDSIKVQKTEEHTDLVEINEETKIKMRYPGIEFFAEGLKIDSIADSSATVCKCVASIVIGEEVYTAGDMTEDEVAEWLDGLSTADYTKILEFFRTMPKLTHTIKLKNRNSGEDFQVVLTGLADFF